MARLKETTAAAPSSRAPRFALGWAALVYALATLSLGYPALGGGFLVNPFSDQYIAGYAFREFAAATLRTTATFPQWNPYLFGGMPYVAAMHGDIFYPTFLLRLILPTDVAMTWGFIIHVFLAGLFTYVFLRAVGLSFGAALIGGLAYMMGGNVAGLVSPGHDGKLYLSALLPLTLFLLVRGVRDGRRWAWGAIAIVVGLAVLTPHPQLLQYLLLLGGFFALFLAFADTGTGPLDRTVALRRLAYGLGAVAIGGAIGAIQYLPVSEYVAWSPRAGGKGWEHAVSYSMPPEELINVFLPEFSGLHQSYWGRNSIHLHSEYLGAAVLVLAGLGFGARAVVRRSFLWFWTGAFLVTLLWALGGYAPFFYRLVYAIVPGTKFFRAPSTILYIVQFTVAVLAAMGAERVARRQISTRYVLAWMGAALLIAVIATSGGLTNLGASIADPRLADRVFANAGAVTAGAWRSFAFVLLTGGVLLAVAVGRVDPRAALGALVVLVGADLWSVERKYWLFSPPAAVTFASDSTIEYLKRQPQPARVIVNEDQRLPSEAVRDPFLNGDALMVHRVRQVLGYHGNEIGRYQRLYQSFLGSSSIGHPNFLRLVNASFFLTNVPDAPGLERVAGPARNASGSMVYLYRLPGDNRVAWVTPIIVKAPDDAVLPTLMDERFDVRRAALFDTSSGVKGVTVTTLPEPLTIATRVTRYEPGRISLELDAPAPAGSALVVSENYYPGWTATADGRPATVGRADLSLMGVELPTGARRIELAFSSATYATGKTITLAALGLSLALLVAGVVADRRRGA